MQMVANRRRTASSKRMRLGLLGLTAAALTMLFVVAVPGTFGSFTASTLNAGNSFTAGTLQMTNSDTGTHIVAGSNMQPGDSQSGIVAITNSGSLPAVVTLSESSIVPGTGAPNVFAHDLLLTVTDCGTISDCSGAKSNIYGGSGGAAFDSLGTNVTLPPAGGSKWLASEVHYYQFTVLFPNGTPDNDNQYQNQTASAEFDWNSTAQH